MKHVNATDAARGFGRLVEEIQAEPVTIEKNGRPVAVLYSYREAQEVEALKLAELKRFIDIGVKSADEGKMRPLTKEIMDDIKAKGRIRYQKNIKT